MDLDITTVDGKDFFHSILRLVRDMKASPLCPGGRVRCGRFLVTVSDPFRRWKTDGIGVHVTERVGDDEWTPEGGNNPSTWFRI